MLELASARGVYGELQKADLLKPLPLADGSFDVVTCVGTTTYLEPTALSDWARCVRPGGLIVFTHKSAMLESVAWTEAQAALVHAGVWSSVWVSDGLDYLPTLAAQCRERADEVVKIFVYRKL